jgi:hypothetical protein
MSEVIAMNEDIALAIKSAKISPSFILIIKLDAALHLLFYDDHGIT